MPITVIIFLISLIILAAILCALSYRKHILGYSAKERNIDIRILDKQSVAPLTPDFDEEYWIYVEPLSGGPKREFQIGIHYYHALHPGDCGTLNYKGISFLHFAKFQLSS